jgi:hypothetical protein
VRDEPSQKGRNAPPFKCPGCNRDIDITWPSGDPIISISTQRTFHVTTAPGTQTSEPAGWIEHRMCLPCSDALWRDLKQLLRGRGWDKTATA